jgi:uncharacterized membrane protein
MPATLIGPEQDFALWAILIGLAAFGFWCERYAWGRRFSGVMMLIAAGILLSNLRVIPTTAPVYDATWNYLVPVAIPLLLFGADLRRIVREAGPMLVAFVISAVGVVAGTIVGVMLLGLGPQEPELAGVFSATYIGGSLNFAAVAEATGFRESSLLAASIAADNVATNVHFLLIIALPGIAWVARRFPSRHIEAAAAEGGGDGPLLHRIADLSMAGLLAGLALAFSLAALGNWIADALGTPQFAILVITLLALMVGTLLPRQVARLSGHREAGNALMYVFLAGVGASADVWVLIETAPILFVFATIIITVHLIVLLAVGRLLNLDLAELVMASAVAIGGPSSAPAIASAKRWPALLIPGVLCGSLGYAIGSFIGVAIVEWLR